MTRGDTQQPSPNPPDGDLVSISAPELGTLVNRVTPSEQAPAWDFGVRDLFRSLAAERR